MLYHKIQTMWKRDPATKHKTLLHGEWSLPEFEYLAEMPWAFTEKVDGTNVRILTSEHGAMIGGRTEHAQLHAGLVQHCSEVADRAREAGVIDLYLMGEGYGAKIQGGGDYRKDQGFILFDVATPEGIYLERHNVEDIAAKIGVPVVPIVEVGTLWDAYYTLSDSELAPLSQVSEEAQVMEGFVMRPTTELRTRRGERVITKLKVKDFA